jgi:hypothetical protein
MERSGIAPVDPPPGGRKLIVALLSLGKACVSHVYKNVGNGKLLPKHCVT